MNSWNPDRQPEVAFVGLGNPYRGDDAIGYRVVEALQSAIPAAATYTIQDDFTPLLTIFENHPICLLFDAVLTEAPPGTIIEMDLLNEPLHELDVLATSSHHLPLEQIIALARQMDCLPRVLHLFGIVGAQFALGSEIQPAVLEAIPEVVTRCRQLLATVIS